MKKLLLSLILLLTSVLSFGQTEVDIWKKQGAIKKIFSTRKFTFPKNFTSRAPSGKQIVYERVEHPRIKMETSSGRKWLKSPIIYKSTQDFGVITYDGKNWSGLHTEDGYNVSNLTKEVVTNVKMDGEKFHFGEKGDVLIAPLKSTNRTGKSIENNPDFYSPSIRINKTCGVYVEITNDLYRFWGSDTGRVSQYVTTILTNVIALYDREGINVRLNKVFIWDTPDPYGNPFDNSQYLNQFTDNINKNIPTSPEAHFKHLLHNKNFGGIAWINGESDGYTTTPNLDPYYTCSVTGIGSNLVVNSNTTYSWPVMCFAHEMGHNLGAKHTHWCGWKNDVGTNIGRIDSCYRGESSDGPANCTSSTFTITKANSRGSIMSYCHLNGAISFTTGFGRLPRYAIRSNLNGAVEVPFDISQVPLVTVDTGTQKLASSVLMTGNIESTSVIQDRGVVWSLVSSNTIPTLDLTTKISSGTGIGTFQSQVTGLLAGGVYWIRAYAKNTTGVYYSDTVRVRLPASSPPGLTTNPLVAITENSVQTGGTYISIGASIIERGFVYSTTNQTPTVTDTKFDLSTSFGNSNFPFNNTPVVVTGLSPNTTYYIRAFARNNFGTSYGNVRTFTTSPSTSVSFGDLVFASIGNASIFPYILINSVGTGTVSERGFYISTSTNPETNIANKRAATTLTPTVGAMTFNLVGLTANTLYYVKAFVTTNNGTFFSGENSIRTARLALTMDSVIKIESNNATLKYTIGPGLNNFTVSGVLVSTINNPVRSTGGVLYFTSPQIEQGSGTVLATGLLPNTTYFARALIQTISGDIYSPTSVQFTTTSTQGIPTLTTTDVISKTSTSINIGGVVTSEGTSPIFSRGVCYSTAPNPTIQNSTVISNGRLGQFSVTLNNLAPLTIYYIRSFATNKSGTSYGQEINTRTVGVVPTVTTKQPTDITLYTANTGGIIVNGGQGVVSLKGVIWSTDPNPTVDLNTKTSDGSGLGEYTSALQGLSLNTLYYIRAYAYNENGVGYGQQVTFRTASPSTTPTVITNGVTDVGPTSAKSGGNVTSDGGEPITQKGVCWSTSPNPTINLPTRTIDGDGLGSFESNITELTLGVTYYVRAYAVNVNGASYGNQVVLSTSTGVPTLTTSPITSITAGSANGGGVVTLSGNSPVTQRGVCWSTTQNPTISSNITRDGVGLGAFTSTITGLTQNTTYYIRAYAQNSSGVGYGPQLSFTTAPLGSGSCQLSNLSAYQNQNNAWVFKYSINSRCATYSVNVCRYNLSNPNVQPTSASIPTSCGIRNGMVSYVPTTQENSLNLIEKVMDPQPTAATKSGFGGWWYSVDVKCNSQSCLGTNLTKYYFYVPGL